MFLSRAVLTSSLLFLLSTPSLADEVSMGMAAARGPDHFAQEAEKTGANDHLVVYWTLGKQGQHPYQRFQSGADIVLGLKFPNIEGDLLAEIASGRFDDELRELAGHIRSDGRKIMVRALYEGNGSWYHWHAYHKDNNAENFIPAFRHITTFLRNEAPGLVSFDLNLNRRSANGQVDNFHEVYPGDDFVDFVTISSYNRCGASDNHTELRSFAEEFRPAYQELERISNVPLGIAETATTEWCDVNRIDWYADLLNSLREEFTRVAHVTFFFEVIPVGLASNTREIRWQLYEKEKPAFKNLIKQFRSGNTVSPMSVGKEAPKNPPEPEAEPQPTQPEKEAQDPEASKPARTFGKADPSVQPSMPWTFYLRTEHFLNETENTAINAVSGKPFGFVGSRLRTQLTQGFMWDLDYGKSFGHQFSVGAVVSSGNEQWWNNQVFMRADTRYCVEHSFANWGSTCVLGGVQRIEYLSDTPGRFNESALIGTGYENQVFIGIESSFGGDWRK